MAATRIRMGTGREGFRNRVSSGLWLCQLQRSAAAWRYGVAGKINVPLRAQVRFECHGQTRLATCSWLIFCLHNHALLRDSSCVSKPAGRTVRFALSAKQGGNLEVIGSFQWCVGARGNELGLAVK